MLHYLDFKIILVILLCLPLAACTKWFGDNISKPPQPLVAELGEPLLEGQENRTQETPLKTANIALEERWIVSAAEAKQLIEQGATVLDARGRGINLRQIQGAIAVKWSQFSQKDPVMRGRLLDNDDQLTQQLQALGISNNRPVVVFGKPPDGWGEDGRVVWMLRTLGHPQAVLVDGGFQALVDAEVALQQGPAATPTPGNFVVQRDPSWNIQQDTLRQRLDTEDVVLIDTREPREFAGKTPYGEARGGHVPGAVNLYFKDLMAEDGRLLPRSRLLAKLQEHGITPDRQIVAYCTGGVRSGWLTSVLVTLEFEVQNYAGSMWEWSAAPEERYPLQKVPQPQAPVEQSGR